MYKEEYLMYYKLVSEVFRGFVPKEENVCFYKHHGKHIVKSILLLKQSTENKEVIHIANASLDRLLKMIEFKYKMENNRWHLYELTHFIHQRITYLRKYCKNLNENPLRCVYLD